MKHLERALLDSNEGWRYFVNFLISFIGASILGSIPLLIVLLFSGFKKGQLDPAMFEDLSKGVLDFEALGIDGNIGLLLMLLPFVLAFIFFIVCMRWFHNRNWIEVINGLKKIRWGRFFMGYGVWFSLAALFLAYSYFTSPGDFEFQFHWSTFLPLFFISVLLIPLQSSYEELFFRGYLAQGFATWTGNRMLAILLPSLLFGMLHAFNPEVHEYGFWLTMPQYIGFGIIFGIASTLDDGIETAMGAHAANNTFLSLFLTSEASALQTNAILKQTSVHPESETYSLLFFGIVFLIVLSIFYKWDWRILGRKVTAADLSISE